MTTTRRSDTASKQNRHLASHVHITGCSMQFHDLASQIKACMFILQQDTGCKPICSSRPSYKTKRVLVWSLGPNCPTVITTLHCTMMEYEVPQGPSRITSRSCDLALPPGHTECCQLQPTRRSRQRTAVLSNTQPALTSPSSVTHSQALAHSHIHPDMHDMLHLVILHSLHATALRLCCYVTPPMLTFRQLIAQQTDNQHCQTKVLCQSTTTLTICTCCDRCAARVALTVSLLSSA